MHSVFPDMIAIDPSLNSTGIAYFDEYGDIHTETVKIKKLRGSARLMHIRNAIHDRLLEDDGPVIYEDYAYGAKGRAVFDIGELGGVVKLLCYELGIEVLLVPPTTLKLFMTGKGNADKEAMAHSIRATYDRNFETDDEADAFALLKLGGAYYSSRKLRACSPKVRESLAKCERLSGKIITCN